MITRWAIEKNRITATVLCVIFIAGIQAYQNMSRAEDPGFIIRMARIVTYFPGASPERVEMLVTDKLEKAIQEMPELDFVQSESRTGVSVINVNILESYTEMQPIWDKLRRKVERVAPDLPDSVEGPNVNDEFGDVFGIIVTLTGDGFSYVDLKDVADDVRDELLLIPEAAKVEIHGAQEERIFVEYSNARLAELGLSPVQLQGILQARNIIIPGGDLTTRNEKIVLEPSGNFESVEDLRRTIVNIPGTNELVELQDIARLRRDYLDPPEAIVRFNGTPALALGISMREGGNIITLGDAVQETIRRLQSVYPVGLEIDLLQFQPEPVARKVNDFASNLMQAIAIVAGVMLVTLGLRTGLVVTSLIPSAIVAALLVMSLLGIGLDQMSLASLIIALGMLVDNSIVMAESITVQMTKGKAAKEAAIDTAAELAIPLLTSSLTTAAAFLPIFLAESAVGEYTAPIFKVVTITLLCSWVLSLTVIPLFCVLFLRVTPNTRGDLFASRFYRTYRGLLLTGLRNRMAALMAVAGMFALAIFGFRFVPNIFFPPNDRETFSVELELPAGTPIEATERVVVELDEFIGSELMASDNEPGVTHWGAFIGQGAPRYVLGYGPEAASPAYAYVIVNTTDRPTVDALIPRVERFCLENFPGLKPIVRPLENGPPAWPPVAIRISGRNPERLFRIADEVKAHLRDTPETKLVDDDWGARSKKLIVDVNEARARRAGVTNQDIAISLQASLSGFETTQFREDDDLIPVILRSVSSEQKDLTRLQSLNVYSQSSGQSVPLDQVADTQVAWEPSKVVRRGRLRTITIEAGLTAGHTAAEVNATLAPWLEEQQRAWGHGYSWEFGGEAESSGKANASIAAKLPVAGLIILLLLVAQFNSMRRPLIILITIPLGLIGVVIGLLTTRLYFGFMTLLGVISLAGIVINNAIVLLDRIQVEIEQNGLDPARAVIESAQQRLRPILLTTLTTVGGLLPLYLGGGPMWEPMAITIMSGLLFATALTLGVVPILYSLFFRVNFRDFRYD